MRFLEKGAAIAGAASVTASGAAWDFGKASVLPTGTNCANFFADDPGACRAVDEGSN